MALPKVTPGSYNYGAYANPQQVKLADTSSIGRGLEKVAAGTTRALDIQRQQKEKKAAEDRADKIRQEGYEQQEKMARLSSDLIEGRDIRKSQRQEKMLDERALKKDFIDAYEMGLKLDSINAKAITDKTMQSAAEYAQSVRNDNTLSPEEKRAKLGAAEDNFEELLLTDTLIKSVIGNKTILDVPASEILSEEGRILQGLAKSGGADIVALSDYDGAGLGAEYTFQYETGNMKADGTPEVKVVSMPAYQIKNLIQNADRNFEVKHTFGTQEDLAAVNLFKNVYANSSMKLDPLYYSEEGKLNEQEFVNMLMNDQTVVSQVAGTQSAASLYKTLYGQNYQPNNTLHRERIAKYYAEAAMQSIKIQNPGIFDQPPTAKTQTGLTADAYNKLGSQGEKENALKVELIRQAQQGNIDVLKSNKAFETFMFDGKTYKGTIIDEDGDEVEKTFTPAEMVDQYVNMMPKTWRATTEGSIFSKKQEGGIDMGEFNQNVVSQ